MQLENHSFHFQSKMCLNFPRSSHRQCTFDAYPLGRVHAARGPQSPGGHLRVRRALHWLWAAGQFVRQQTGHFVFNQRLESSKFFFFLEIKDPLLNEKNVPLQKLNPRTILTSRAVWCTDTGATASVRCCRNTADWLRPPLRTDCSSIRATIILHRFR